MKTLQCWAIVWESGTSWISYMSDSCSLSPPLSWIRSNRITVRDFSPHSNDGIWVTILCSSLPDAYYALASVCQIRVGLRKGKAIKHHETRCHMMCRSAGISISKSFPKACLQTRNVSVFQGGGCCACDCGSLLLSFCTVVLFSTSLT